MGQRDFTIKSASVALLPLLAICLFCFGLYFLCSLSNWYLLWLKRRGEAERISLVFGQVFLLFGLPFALMLQRFPGLPLGWLALVLVAVDPMSWMIAGYLVRRGWRDQK